MNFRYQVSLSGGTHTYVKNGIELDLLIRQGFERGLTLYDFSIEIVPPHGADPHPLLDLATEVFDSVEVANEWFRTKNLVLDGRTPLSLLGTPTGIDRVKTLLQQVQYGVLA